MRMKRSSYCVTLAPVHPTPPVLSVVPFIRTSPSHSGRVRNSVGPYCTRIPKTRQQFARPLSYSPFSFPETLCAIHRVWTESSHPGAPENRRAWSESYRPCTRTTGARQRTTRLSACPTQPCNVEALRSVRAAAAAAAAVTSTRTTSADETKRSSARAAFSEGAGTKKKKLVTN